MEQGPVEERIISQCMREGLELPDRMRNAPELALGLGLYYKAFSDVNTSRYISMVEGPIPWHIIEQYCDANKLSEEQRDDMHYFIREMDDAYLTYRAKQRGDK